MGKLAARSSYLINSYILERVSYINDLGIMLDSKLQFNVHIETSVNEWICQSLLGFIKRRSNTLDDPYLTKSLYKSIVRQILKYSVVVWAPSYGYYVAFIESVERQFLLFALRDLAFSVTLSSYANWWRLIDLRQNRKRWAWYLLPK